ncbi:DEAD/DEAH box helicase, partial [archaeon]
VRINVGSTDLSANHRVKQIVEVITSNEKATRLKTLLQTYHAQRNNRILIFVLYKKEAVEVQGMLERWGYSVGGIHGDLAQGERQRALNAFKRGEVPLLIATDVAARGLDIPQVEVRCMCMSKDMCICVHVCTCVCIHALSVLLKVFLLCANANWLHSVYV